VYFAAVYRGLYLEGSLRVEKVKKL
jgi:hypothetical protein